MVHAPCWNPAGSTYPLRQTTHLVRTARAIILMKHQMWFLADLAYLPHITSPCILMDRHIVYGTKEFLGDLEMLSFCNP